MRHLHRLNDVLVSLQIHQMTYFSTYGSSLVCKFFVLLVSRLHQNLPILLELLEFLLMQIPIHQRLRITLHWRILLRHMLYLCWNKLVLHFYLQIYNIYFIECPLSTTLLHNVANVKLIFSLLGWFSITDLLLLMHKANLPLYCFMYVPKNLLASSIVLICANLSSCGIRCCNVWKRRSTLGLNSGTELVSMCMPNWWHAYAYCVKVSSSMLEDAFFLYVKTVLLSVFIRYGIPYFVNIWCVIL